MTVRDIKVFLAVCEAQSMSVAAANLSISQSAVSQAIREIEHYFETKLFYRSSNKVFLTESGRNMLQCSDHIISYLSHMESVMRSNKFINVLHVGCFSQYLLVDLVKNYQKVNTDVQIILHVYNHHELVSMLSVGALDIIITDSCPGIQDSVSNLFDTNKTTFICHPESQLHPALSAEHPVLQISDLENIPVLLRNEGNSTRIQFEEQMLAKNARYFCKGFFSTYDGIYSAVEGDLGIGLTIKRASHIFNTRFKPVEIKDIDITQESYITYMTRRQTKPYLQDFVDYSKAHVAQLLNDPKRFHQF